MSDAYQNANGESSSRPIFIHSSLDDYGLTTAEFRVYAHLARRDGGNGAFPSVRTIAAVCRIDPKTAKRCIKELTRLALIEKEPRRGRTSVFNLTPIERWQPGPKDPLGQKTPQGALYPTTQAKSHSTHLGQSAPPEGSPLKDIHKVHPIASPNALEIYDVYPRKVGRPAALRAIAKAAKEFGCEKLLARTKDFAAKWAGQPSLQFCPHPTTWFSQQRYADDPATWGPRDTNANPAPSWEQQKRLRNQLDELKFNLACPHDESEGEVIKSKIEQVKQKLKAYDP